MGKPRYTPAPSVNECYGISLNRAAERRRLQGPRGRVRWRQVRPVRSVRACDPVVRRQLSVPLATGVTPKGIPAIMDPCGNGPHGHWPGSLSGIFGRRPGVWLANHRAPL